MLQSGLCFCRPHGGTSFKESYWACLWHREKKKRNNLFNRRIWLVGISSAGCSQYFKNQRVFFISNEASSSEQEWGCFLGTNNHRGFNKVGSVCNNSCVLKRKICTKHFLINCSETVLCPDQEHHNSSGLWQLPLLHQLQIHIQLLFLARHHQNCCFPRSICYLDRSTR